MRYEMKASSAEWLQVPVVNLLCSEMRRASVSECVYHSSEPVRKRHPLVEQSKILPSSILSLCGPWISCSCQWVIKQ